MTLTIGFSTCPNDTFIFDALVNGKIDTGGITWQPVLDDVQTLNEWALQGKLDVTKISYGALPWLLDTYRVLPAGGALGVGVGPLLIGSIPPPAGADFFEQSLKVQEYSIAIPGRHTTAHFLFSHAYPKAYKKVFMRFDDIETYVQQEKGLGVIIHENRFTYKAKGLHAWADLGKLWENQTSLPIPLGGIVVKRSLSKNLQRQINQQIKNSLAHAWQLYPLLSPYVKKNAAEMDEQIMQQHIALYVNDFSIEMGPEGKAAIMRLLKTLNPQQNFAESEVFMQ
jgi:1,4-dihydroxy-6-naphthoate synthase